MKKGFANMRLAISLWFMATFGLLVALAGCGDISGNNTPVMPVPGAKQTEEPIRVRGVQEIDLANYNKIPLSAEQIQVSSFFQPTMKGDNLVKPGKTGFWHVSMPKEEQSPSVTITLDESRPVALLSVLPRGGKLMWRGNTAMLQVSDDGQHWATAATLDVIPWPPEKDWMNFLVLIPQPHRYYRLSIQDINFISLARLELYQLEGYGPPLPKSETTPRATPSPTVAPPASIPSAPLAPGTHDLDVSELVWLRVGADQIQVSSIHRPSMGGERLIQPGKDGYWHVKAPREEIPAWVFVSLDTPTPITAIRILPRTGLLAHLWNGDTAILEGSNNTYDWTPLATLSLDKSSLREDWIGFSLNLPDAFQFYRIAIFDPKFLSMARLEIYATP